MTTEIERRVDIKNWLPYGEQLRVLLSSDHISLGEISSLARAKGLFAAELDRGQLIQFLSTTIIKPIEFEQLIASSISRESRPKEQPQDVTLTSKDADWKSKVLEVGKDIESFVNLDRLPGTTFKLAPVISAVSRSHLIISYEISRQDYSRDLLDRDLTFQGEISINQQGDALNLKIISTHTAKETDRINEQILGHIVKSLKNAGMAKEDAPLKISFGSFTNKNRILFLLKLAGDAGISQTPGEIIDLNMKPNEARTNLGQIPELKVFEGSIKNMRMDGDKLNDILLLTNDDLYEHFFLTRVAVNYEFTVDQFTGTCTVLFYFQLSRGSESLAAAPFSFSIDALSLSKSMQSSQVSAAKRAVTNALRAAVDNWYISLREI